MNNKIFKTLAIMAVLVAAASTRLFPHALNFTPITAIALFGTAYLPNNTLKFVLPLTVIFLSDCFLQLSNGTGFYQGMEIVYLAYSLMIVFGMFIMKKVSITHVAFASIGSSILFFLITNFALFYTNSDVLNPALAGISNPMERIIASYTVAIPFFRNSVMSDLIFSGILFGAASLVSKVVKLPKTA